MTYSMVVAAFSTTVLCSQQRVTIQTLTECARHCGQMSVLNFTWVFTMFLFLLVTREILDFVCFQILQAYYLMIQSFDAVLLNGMQTRWLAPDHFFLQLHIPCRIVLANYGTILAIRQEQREPQASQRSLFLCQYSH